MRITSLWVVIDPIPASTLRDICFQADSVMVFIHWAIGASVFKPERVKTTALYTDEAEAKADAERRLTARDAGPAA